MTKSHKKIILFLIVLIELVAGGIGLYSYYNHQLEKNVKYISAIEKKSLTFPKVKNFIQFYELEKNVKQIDNPEWLEKPATYNYNADGFNDRYDYLIEKGDDVFRIITLGDSFTYGHFISTEKNWTELLEDGLNKNIKNSSLKFEVINLGMPGYDVPYIVERYRRHGQKYNPDLVIWFEAGSGFFRNVEETRLYTTVCEEKNGKNNPVEDIFENAKCWNKAQEKLIEKYGGIENLNQFLNLYLDDFINLFPDPKKVLFFAFEQPTDYESTMQKLINIRREKWPDIIIEPIVPDVGWLKQTLPDGHPNEEGHRTIETAIFSYLKEKIENSYWSF